MADWLRLPSGQAVNMDRLLAVRHLDEDDVILVTEVGNVITVVGPDATAVRAYLERVHVGERTAREKPPRGPDYMIRKT